MLCTYDEIYCISVSQDNSIVFWKMTDAEGRVAKLEKDLNYSTEVLVTKYAKAFYLFGLIHE